MKSKLKLKSGILYCRDKNGNMVCTGSQLGRRDVLPPNWDRKEKLRIQLLRLDAGGYDYWGAYWGHPINHRNRLYCVWNSDYTILLFRWAATRNIVKEAVKTQFQYATFYR